MSLSIAWEVCDDRGVEKVKRAKTIEKKESFRVLIQPINNSLVGKVFTNIYYVIC